MACPQVWPFKKAHVPPALVVSQAPCRWRRRGQPPSALAVDPCGMGIVTPISHVRHQSSKKSGDCFPESPCNQWSQILNSGLTGCSNWSVVHTPWPQGPRKTSGAPFKREPFAVDRKGYRTYKSIGCKVCPAMGVGFIIPQRGSPGVAEILKRDWGFC